MKTKRSFRITLRASVIPLFAVVMFSLLSAVSAAGQIERTSDLFKTLKAKDARLFGEGFNKCNLDVFKEIISEHIEFFHDENGLQDSKEQFIKGIETGLCREGTPLVKRTLEEDSLQVFPMNSGGKLYGALQTGVHYFGEAGQARFTHLWLLESGEWKLARVISYDHREKEGTK
jgi:hypothetical protein